MATRSFIGILNPDGSVSGVYCHYDGYPDGVGATLLKHYTDPTKVDALLALGSISILDAEVGEQHSFYAPHRGWTLAYHRDRGEDFEPPMVYSTLRDMLRDVGYDLCAEWAYVFVDGKWETHEI